MAGAPELRDDGWVGELTWDSVAGVFEVDGALRDVYVFDVGRGDWQGVLDVIRAQGWALEYTYAGSPLPLPDRVDEIFDGRGDLTSTLHIRPVPGVLINTHFFVDDEIEFDLDPREIQGQEQLDVLSAFLRTVGKTLRRPVVLTAENTPSWRFLTYNPTDDHFTIP